MSETVQVLLVEDSEDDAFLLQMQLKAHTAPVRIERVYSAAMLEAALDRQPWDIVISDFNLPGFDGLAALELVRSRYPDLPFLLVSATVGEDVAVEAMRAGANDYLMKGRLARLLPAFERELREAMVRKEHQKRLHHLAHFDPITGLANRDLFHQRLAQLLRTAREGRRGLAVAVIDLDRFRVINQSLGRGTGDELLLQVGTRITDSVGDADHVARIGADDFAIVHGDPKGVSELARGTRELLDRCFGEPFRLAGLDYRVAGRAGIALFPQDGDDAEVLLRHAEAAAAKASATTTTCLFYAEEMTREAARKLALENRLRLALEREEFVLHYQPKVDLARRSIVGAEALIRWESGDEGLVHPAEFIPLLEETGMIVEVGAWVLRQAVADIVRWRELGIRAPRIAVNVSVAQLKQPRFVERVRETLAPCGSAPPIDLEVTESLLAGGAEAGLATLKALRALGVGLAIDDFGTGYSSLAYLARLPVQQLKIDRTFVDGMLSDPQAMTLVSTMIILAKALGLTTVAEGVEWEEQARALRDAGCDQIQGYLCGRPGPFDTLTPRLDRASVLRPVR